MEAKKIDDLGDTVGPVTPQVSVVHKDPDDNLSMHDTVSPVTPQISVVRRSLDDSASSEPSLQDPKPSDLPEAEFKPSRRLFVAFGTLAVITLMVALDGTSLSVALPVRLLY